MLGYTYNLQIIILFNLWRIVNCERVSSLNKSADLLKRDDAILPIRNSTVVKALLSSRISQLVHWEVQHDFRSGLKSKAEDAEHELSQIFQSDAQVFGVDLVDINSLVKLVDNFRISKHLIFDFCLN